MEPIDLARGDAETHPSTASLLPKLFISPEDSSTRGTTL
jgi:hypothetical protein